jgi:hypothetical protein
MSDELEPEIIYVNELNAALLNEVNQPTNEFPEFFAGWYIDGLFAGGSLTHRAVWTWYIWLFDAKALALAASIGVITSDSFKPRDITGNVLMNLFIFFLTSIVGFVVPVTLGILHDVFLLPIEFLGNFRIACKLREQGNQWQWTNGKTNVERVEFIKNTLQYSPFNN